MNLRKFRPFHKRSNMDQGIISIPLPSTGTSESKLPDDQQPPVANPIIPVTQRNLEPPNSDDQQPPVASPGKLPAIPVNRESLEPPDFDIDTGREASPLPDVPDQARKPQLPAREPEISRPRNLVESPKTPKNKVPRALARLLPHNEPGKGELVPLGPTRRSSPRGK